MHAVGRLGVISTGILGGLLFETGWDFRKAFISLSFPAVICFAAVAVIDVRSVKSHSGPLPAEDPSS
jgi:hypothetical protein